MTEEMSIEPDLTLTAQKVRLFERQFGAEYRLLAYHAALPLVLTPELVHYLRTEFLLSKGVPWEAEADLLLSDLCSQVGYELYAMDTEVRSYLLAEMHQDPRIPTDRIAEVARVLISYVAYLSRVNPGHRQQELQAQRWAAMTYLGETECDRVVAEIAQSFSESSDRQDTNAVKAEFARLARITEALAPQLVNHPDLLNLAQAVNRSLKDPQAIGQRDYLIRDRVVTIPWVEESPIAPLPELTSFEFDVAEFLESNVPPLQKIPHRFDVATIEIQNGTQIVIKKQPKEDWQYVETLTPNLTLELIQIPSGRFIMGAPKGEEDSRDSERPQHSVEVSEFYMGKYPVTQIQWRFGASLPQIDRGLDPNPSYFKGDNLPVERVSWLDAVEFCARLSRHTGRSYRLPSEAEWEYACRAGTTTPFHFGETIDPQIANYDANYTYGRGRVGEYRRKTTPVGYFRVANNFGLFDLHGNVWEWCQEHWHENYQYPPKNGAPWLDLEAAKTSRRVLRGGSWFNYPFDCRSAVRSYFNAENRIFDIGFRLVMTTRTL